LQACKGSGSSVSRLRFAKPANCSGFPVSPHGPSSLTPTHAYVCKAWKGSINAWKGEFPPLPPEAWNASSLPSIAWKGFLPRGKALSFSSPFHPFKFCLEKRPPFPPQGLARLPPSLPPPPLSLHPLTSPSPPPSPLPSPQNLERFRPFPPRSRPFRATSILLSLSPSFTI